MRKLTAAQVVPYLPPDWKAPHSAFTPAEEIEMSLGIGGRLPHIHYIELHFHGKYFQRDPAVDEAIRKATINQASTVLPKKK